MIYIALKIVGQGLSSKKKKIPFYPPGHFYKHYIKTIMTVLKIHVQYADCWPFRPKEKTKNY